MPVVVKDILKCRMCDSEKLQLFLDLGNIPRVDRFLSQKELSQTEQSFPLTVYLCESCGLSQLGFIVPASKLFNEEGFRYVAKSMWKEQVRDVGKTEEISTTIGKKTHNKISQATKRHLRKKNK